MRITQWGEYGVHCAVYLASCHAAGREVIGAQEIADSQQIALDYTQQVLQRLRKGQVIESVRGPQGGYKLARSADTINLKDILAAAEGETFEIICDHRPLAQGRCAPDAYCGLRNIWHDFKTHVDAFLIRHTLADLSKNSASEVDAPIQIQRPIHP